MKTLSDNTHNIITFDRRIPVLSTIFFIGFFGCFGLYFFSTHTKYPLHIKLFQIIVCALITLYACYSLYESLKRIRIPILQLSPSHLEYDAFDWVQYKYDKKIIPWKNITSVTFKKKYYSKDYTYIVCIQVGKSTEIKIALNDIATSPYTLRKAFENYKPIPLSPMRAFYYDNLYPWRYLLFFICMLFGISLMAYIHRLIQ